MRIPPCPAPQDADAAAASNPPRCCACGAGKHYGAFTALDGIDLDVARGEVIALIGPSGSGKSTLVRCVNLLETYDGGSVEVDGITVRDDRRLARVRAEVGMVFQQFNLFPHMSALRNVALAPVRVRGLSWPEATARAEALLERVGLRDHQHKRPGQLSGGQQQRVAIARAWPCSPSCCCSTSPRRRWTRKWCRKCWT